MSLSYCLLLSENLAVPAVQLTFSRAAPALSRRRTAVSVTFSAGDGIPARIAELKKSSPIILKQSSVSTPTNQLARSLGIRPSPELGLLSLLFVLTTAAGAIFSLAFISIPAMYAFRRLAASVDKLSEVVAEEVPGTLSSLKLSGLEINDLTQQLSNLRQKISGIQPGTKDRRNKPRSKGGRNNPIIN